MTGLIPPEYTGIHFQEHRLVRLKRHLKYTVILLMKLVESQPLQQSSFEWSQYQEYRNCAQQRI